MYEVVVIVAGVKGINVVFVVVVFIEVGDVLVEGVVSDQSG